MFFWFCERSVEPDVSAVKVIPAGWQGRTEIYSGNPSPGFAPAVTATAPSAAATGYFAGWRLDGPERPATYAYNPATIGMRAARIAGNSPPTNPTISASATPSKISHPESLKSNTTCVKFPPSVEAVTPSKIR
jgi:hypothetical protein